MDYFFKKNQIHTSKVTTLKKGGQITKMVITEIEVKTENPQGIRRAVAYARVSTNKEEQENSLVFQEEYWEHKIKDSPELKFCGIYADQGISGKSTKLRKQFNEMIRQAKLGKIDIIFTKSISRFGRNVVETLTTVRELRQCNTEVYFEKENISTMDKTSELMLSILSSISEQELYSMGDNVRVAARHRFSQGSVEVNKKILGYTLDKNNKLIIVPEEAEIIKKIFDLAQSGYGMIKIAKELESLGYKTSYGHSNWSMSSISRILKNEKYTGNALLQKGISENGKRRLNKGELEQYYIENSHSPIISQAVFDEVQKGINDRIIPLQSAYESSKIYDFTSLITCGNCGKHYIKRTCLKGQNKEFYKWACRTSNLYGIDVCNAHSIKEKVLQEKFIECFNEFVRAPVQESSSPLKESLKECLRQEQELNKLVVKGHISKLQFDTELKELLIKIKNYESKLKIEKMANGFDIDSVEITAFDSELVIKYVEKVIVSEWTVTFIFINGHQSGRTYTNGKCGNKRKN